MRAAPSARNRPAIAAENALNYVGQTGTVCGTVASVRYAVHTKGQPTFLNLNRPYPNQIFTALVWGRDRAKFLEPPETCYRGRKICVTGRIVEYRGKAEIIVKDPSQITASQ